MVATLTASALSDAAPSQRVQIDIDGLPVAASITVLRLLPTGESAIRGGLNRAVSGAVTLTDFEVPLGIAVTYRAAVTVSGVTTYTNSQTVTLAYRPGSMVLSDPLVPGNAIEVIAEQQAGREPTYQMTQETYRVGLRTVALVSSPGLLTGLPMNLITLTREDRDMVMKIILESGGLVLFRTPPEMTIPALIYCVATAVPLDYVEEDGDVVSKWSVKADQISPSPIDIAVPLITYQMYSTAYATYAAFNAAYSTYIDALRNPPGD